MHRRSGWTLVELVAALVVLATWTAVALPRLRALADRVAVRQGAHEVRTALALARQRAVTLARPVAVLVDSGAGALAVTDAQGVLSTHAVASSQGVRLTATRDSVAFGPLGLGWGASNVSVIVARGGAAETVTVSRAGRIR